MCSLFGDLRNHLDTRRSGADHPHALAGEPDFVMRPAAGETDLSLEVLNAVDFRWLWRGEVSSSHDVVPAGHRGALVGDQQPAFLALVPLRCHDLAGKANVAAQIVAIGYKSKIAEDFGLGGIFFRPLPRLLKLRIERVAVIDALDIAARARISIPVPGPADI